MGGHDNHELPEVTRDDLFKQPVASNWLWVPFEVCAAMVDKPVTWFHDNVVMKVRRAPRPYYHRKFPRVPSIDNCSTEDVVCCIEADHQFKRDRMVDQNVLRILRYRKLECKRWHGPDLRELRELCGPMDQAYEDAATNYHIKYGDLGYYGTVKDAYMKQKHRLLWERRNGPVGSQKPVDDVEAEENMLTILRGNKKYWSKDIGY